MKIKVMTLAMSVAMLGITSCSKTDVYDEKQQELNEANRQLIEMTQKYQQLSGKWYVRLLNQKS